MAVIARTNAPRPPLHGRVVEVHDRRGLLKTPDVFDLRVIIWSPKFGVHAHSLPGIRGITHAIAVAERIGQAEARATR
ncbi:hypothetical protein [Microbacterium saperdae]|uniref:Uncharacterized protein n=1 Tax=Microbacterium saperdae TaxID=69368 RepID=A0A543BQX3_9MICO|nr:hypothetical protein [Microbacterium saperdae]TQL87224.1 hypothetical protein FB560_2891 [Microbacterium saperdae]GGM41978.1 hypothetical protein GCM10010489_11260 [Microbacterium saperdae]